MVLSVNDANLGSLRGLPDVEFDFGVAADVASAFRSAASSLRGQRGSRISYRNTGSTEFAGPYAEVYGSNSQVQLADLDEIVTYLEQAATAVERLAEQAREENRRRRLAREWAERRAERNALQGWFEDHIWGGEEPPFSEVSSPGDVGPSQSVPAPRQGQRGSSSAGGGGGTCSARVENLRSFVSGTRSLDEALAGLPGRLDGVCASFASACSWAKLDASSVIAGLRSWLAANANEANWVEIVAQAFEDAGTVGGLGSLPAAALQATLAARGVSVGRSDIVIDPPVAYGSPPTTGYSDDPVNTATGNFVENEEDLPFVGVAAGVSWLRSYSSLNDTVGAFGPGWSSWCEAGLNVGDDGARLRLFDGRIIVFPAPIPGEKVRAVGESLWLEHGQTKDGSDAYVVSSSWGLRWVLSPAGRLLSAYQADGGTLLFTYDTSGHLTSLSHECGRGCDVVWDEACKRVVQVRTWDGRVASYSYDEAGRLISVEAGAGKRSYVWDEAGFLAKVIDADGVVEAENTFDELGRITSQLSPFGRTTHYAYLADGIVVTSDEDSQVTNTWLHDRHGRLVGVVDADGRRQSTSYDQWGNPVMVTTRDGQVTVNVYDADAHLIKRHLPSGAVLEWAYDTAGRVVSHTVRPEGTSATHGHNSTGREDAEDLADTVAVTRFEYEGDSSQPSTVIDAEGGITTMEWERGLLARVTDPVGVSVSFTHNEYGDLVASTDAVGNTARLERDEAGRITAAVSPSGARTTYSYDKASGALLSSRDPEGGLWRYEYTPGGRLQATVDPLGNRTDIAYGSHGQEEATTDALGRTLTKSYDDMGNLACVALPDGSAWDFGYDALSRLRTFRDASGGTWAMEYAPDGTLSEATDPNGMSRTVSRNVFGQPTHYSDGADEAHAHYDRIGQLVSSVEADGSESIHRYDKCSRLVETIGPSGGVTRYKRDAAGRITAVTQAGGKTFHYAYDACGRWEATISTGGDRFEVTYDADSRIVEELWPTGEKVTTTFDRAGRTLSRCEPGRGAIRFRYDKAGRITQISDPWNGRRSYTYNEVGQVVSVTNALGATTRYIYDDATARATEIIDPLGGKTQRAFDAMGRLTVTTDPLGRTTRFTYDEAGRPLSRTTPDGQTTSWTYHAPGGYRDATFVNDQLFSTTDRDLHRRTVTITDAHGESVETAWDERGNLLRRLRGGVGVSYTYNVDGLRESMTRPDGTTTTYTYDDNHHPRTITTPGVGTTTITRDAIGRITAIDAPGLAASWTWQRGAVTAFEMNRRGFIQRTNITRDDNDRVTSTTTDGITTTYTYDASGQLTSATTSEGFTTSYEYDLNGRLIREVDSGRTTTYTYDASGQLTSAHTPNGTISYTYDHKGWRTRESGPDAERRFTWDPRGYLSSITALRKDGDQHTVTERHDLHVDAGGELASSNDTPLYWDSASLLPVLAQAGSAIITHALAATSLATPDGETMWLTPDAHAAETSADAALTPWHHPSYPLPTVAHSGGQDSEQDQHSFAPLGITASAGVNMGGLEWMTHRAYDPATRAFLSPDPLPPVSGAAWAASPYSYAGNNPVGATDPLGLRPVSEADLRAYQQASASTLQSAAASATSWVKDNWEYIAGGALIVAGVAVMCTGVGGPIGAAMIAGGLTAAGGSVVSQKYSNGSVNWGTVAKDGLIGTATGLVGGGAGALAARATSGMTSCLGRNILVGAVEGGVDGGASNGLTYLTNPGPHTLDGLAQNVGSGAFDGGLMGGAGGALTKVTKIARFGCFTPDTPVTMSDGSTKPIADIHMGDQVLAHNPDTGRDEPATVTNTYTHDNVPILKVTTSNGDINTTATHPFYVEGRGYIQAKDLHTDDTLHTPNGDNLTVKTLQYTGQSTTVYNLATTHNNYYPHTTHGTPLLAHNNGNPAKCTTENLYAVGNATRPSGGRAYGDFGLESELDIIPGRPVPPTSPLEKVKGASTFASLESLKKAPLSGRSYHLPEGTELPEGLAIHADGKDIDINSTQPFGHRTIYPTRDMTVTEFNEKFRGMEWIKGEKLPQSKP